MAEHIDCQACAMLDATPVADLVYEDELWRVGVFDEFGVPGWIIVWLRRHCEATSELTHEEAMSLGPLVVNLSKAIEQTTGATRVYMQVYGERFRHWHMLLSARQDEVPPEHRAWNFLAHAHEYVDVESAHQVASGIRAATSKLLGT